MIATVENENEGVQVFMLALQNEYRIARHNWPEPNPNLAALMEEVGELARALLEHKDEEDVFMEAVQVAVCAMRCAIHGDPQFNGGEHGDKE